MDLLQFEVKPFNCIFFFNISIFPNIPEHFRKNYNLITCKVLMRYYCRPLLTFIRIEYTCVICSLEVLESIASKWHGGNVRSWACMKRYCLLKR